MVHSVCQLDWATGFLDTGSNIILGVSVTVFLGEIKIEISRMSKSDCTS